MLDTTKPATRCNRIHNCVRCGGQLLANQDGPQCLHCDHHHRFPDHALRIAELVAKRAIEPAIGRRMATVEEEC